MRRRSVAVTLDSELERLLDFMDGTLDIADESCSEEQADRIEECRKRLVEFRRLLLIEQTARAR